MKTEKEIKEEIKQQIIILYSKISINNNYENFGKHKTKTFKNFIEYIEKNKDKIYNLTDNNFHTKIKNEKFTLNYEKSIDKNFKIAKTTHIGILKIEGTGRSEKEEYFYETKKYWITWWGRKFTKEGHCIINWSRDHILMETLRERGK